MTSLLRRTQVRFRVPRLDIPSPLGWIALYVGLRLLEYFLASGLVAFGLFLVALVSAVLVFPQSIRDLKKLPTNSDPPTEYLLWRGWVSKLPLVFGSPLIVPLVLVFLLLAVPASVVPTLVVFARDAVLLFCCGLCFWLTSV
ncbi:MAG: hypothetical protein RLZZ156_483 [Deinococcota bacterium]|jgi:hypothetical protein